MHANVTMAATPAPEPAVSDVQYSAPLDPSEAGAFGGGAPAATASGDPGVAVEPDADATQAPVVKSEWDRTPRNADCPCGSGKKFKFCHGAR
jgi:preprotein translocase subunit SecA